MTAQFLQGLESFVSKIKIVDRHTDIPTPPARPRGAFIPKKFKKLDFAFNHFKTQLCFFNFWVGEPSPAWILV